MDISYNLALELFGLKEPVNKDDVLTAFRRLVKCAHPDKGGDEKLFVFITECKDVLLSGGDNKKDNSKKEAHEKNSSKSPNTDTPKAYYISLCDLYDMFYSLHELRQKYNINEIRLTTKLYVYPRFRKSLQKVTTITCSCDYSDFDTYGYVPLKCSVALPKDFEKYNKFSLKFELLGNTFKSSATVNSVVSIKSHKIRFNTILDITLVKSNG